MTIYKVFITAQAEIDIRNIDDYISNELFCPDKAVKIVELIERKVKTLSFFPERGRLYKAGKWAAYNVRVVSVKKYSILFYVDKENKIVTVLHVAYSRRDIDKLLH